MNISNFFENNINRNIETVIKADDRQHISDEVVEYVITKEIATKIQLFFRDYNDYQDANGVWVSGFFGSGKSHLLKILSYVLENKEQDGYRCGELFAEKIENDHMLKGDVLAATRIPSASILFNIDQQAQLTSKSDPNAILSVFYKVFFDYLGYYGFQPHVAEFEMWLDKQGKYQEFMKRFEQQHGIHWTKARIDYFDPLVSDDIAFVLGEMNSQDPSKYENILDEIENRHKQSIEDFSIRVLDYVKTMPSGFRLNFFIDEVGQFISGDTKLMLNIQTIAESLASRTKGQSWMFVTSQEDMEKVVGDMSKSQQNDFSKIQARFRYKIPLTSANVDEVIEKRLLKKTNDAAALLQKIWHKENANLDTLLSFSEVGVQFRKFQGAEDFINKYPFVAYQFSLFQECRRALSTHNAFQGRHQSVGERSMLGVFQQVAKSIADLDETTLVSFDKMYEGIRNELRGEIQKSIILAENNIEDGFAVQLLKTLFMVKYFGNFKPTRRNISVLMIDNMFIDIKNHDKRIDLALNLLENQNYITRNGELFEFLTDDEKDVEERIKSTDIDDSMVNNLLKEIFFDEIIRDNRIRYIGNKQDYEFSSRIDGALVSREKELEIDIITPNNRDFENPEMHQAHTMGSPVMKVLLPLDSIFIKDIKLYLRTNRYIKQNQSTSNRPEVKRILQDKAILNGDKRRNLILLGNKLLTQSTVFMNGARHETSPSTDGRMFIINVFQDLIKIAYPNLDMIGSVTYTEDTIRDILRKKQVELFDKDDHIAGEAHTEVLNFIKRRKTLSERSLLNDVKEYFSHRPYGWYPNAVWSLIAMLYQTDSVALEQDSEQLDADSVLNALINSKYHLNTLVVPKAGERPEDVRALKRLYSELFDETIQATTGREVGNAFKEKLLLMLADVEKLLIQVSKYPFFSQLEPISNQLEKLSKKDYTWLLQNQTDYGDLLLEAKEGFLDPIRKFYNGEQRKIFDSISTIVHSDSSNLDYIDGEELIILKDVLNDKTPFKANKIKDAKTALDSLREKVTQRIKAEREEASLVIENAAEELKQKPEFAALEISMQQQLIKVFSDELSRLENLPYIANIRDIKSRCSNLLTKQLNEMMRMTAKANGKNEVNEPIQHYVNRTTIKVNYPKSELATTDDVEAYTTAFKNALLIEIKNNKRIKL